MSVRDTSAMPVGLRSRVPAKITSSMRTPRRLLADCSPSTQEIASEILDFPHPLGPTTAAMPSPGNFSSVRSQKDLNPRICSFFSLSNFLLLQKQASGTPMRKREIYPSTPANVPREATGVKEKAHNILWISGQVSMISRTVCTIRPKLVWRGYLGGRENRTELS